MHATRATLLLALLGLAACGSPDDEPAATAPPPWLGRWVTDEARVADEAEAWVRAAARERSRTDEPLTPDRVDEAVARAREDALRKRQYLDLRPDRTAVLGWRGGANPSLDWVEGPWTWFEEHGRVVVSGHRRDGRALTPAEVDVWGFRWTGTHLVAVQPVAPNRSSSPIELSRSLRRPRDADGPFPTPPPSQD